LPVEEAILSVASKGVANVRYRIRMVGPPSSKEILMADDRAALRAQSGDSDSPTGCLVRMGWLAGGNVVLMALAILIARGERWTLTGKDVAFGLLVASVVVLRFVDWRRYSRTTADGRSATTAHILRFAVILVGAWSVAWVLAQSLDLG
jgi:hypothetical protein